MKQTCGHQTHGACRAATGRTGRIFLVCVFRAANADAAGCGRGPLGAVHALSAQHAGARGAQAAWLVSMVGARVGAAAAQAALEALCEEDPALAAEAGQASANGAAPGGVPRRYVTGVC